ncbi:MAG TPA: hypothetical protein VES69_07575, partial [Pyrinomonadaceae bacterium]|nr:hypothetical protein [Pyrinomonadaceae bacterium]
QSNAFVVFWLDGGAGSLVEHKTQVAFVEHAEDEPALCSHLCVHFEAKTINPQTQTFLQIRASPTSSVYDPNEG